MSRVPPWFDRRFDFSFPVTLYSNIAARLQGTPARIEEILRFCPDQIRTRKLDGKWSAQEHAGHLFNLEPLWAARVQDFVKGGTELTVADLRNRGTDEANYNAQPLEDILAGFRNARMELLNRVGGLEPELFARTMIHPRLKTPMRLVDHLYFVAEHDDHHLAHILELVST
jgi:DinB superfamily